jgi:hypothetical protein
MCFCFNAVRVPRWQEPVCPLRIDLLRLEWSRQAKPAALQQTAGRRDCTPLPDEPVQPQRGVITMDTYRTFLRAAKTFEEFANAECEIVDTGLTRENARAACLEFNTTRSNDQVQRGLKLEFTKED